MMTPGRTGAQARWVARVALVVGLALTAGALSGCAREAPARAPRLVFTSPPAASATVSPRTTPTATPPDLRVPVLPEVADLLKPLRAFTSGYGDPPAANVGRIRIPRIGVDAPIDARSAPANLDLSWVYSLGPSDVTWYDFGSSPGFGGAPGGRGNAVLSGHVNYSYAVHWAGEAYYNGPGVFAALGRLEPNDGIEVTFRGQTLRYAVAWKREVRAETEWREFYARDVPEGDAITLITCSGGYNPATQEYDSRTIIRARLWSERPVTGAG